MSIYETIVSKLKAQDIPYREYAHGPIYSYEDAERERTKSGWDGAESKSVLMTDKKGYYCLFVTVAGTRVDFARMKEVTDMRLSLASSEEVETLAQCVPGNVPPFGLPIDSLATFVDEAVFSHECYLFSPGVPDRTIELDPRDLRQIFDSIGATYL